MDDEDNKSAMKANDDDGNDKGVLGNGGGDGRRGRGTGDDEGMIKQDT